MITPSRIFLIAILLWSVDAVSAKTEATNKVPPTKFQGIWKVTKVTWQKRDKNEPGANKVTNEKITKGRVDRIHFRRHKSGSLQQFQPSKGSDEAAWSRGITILELTDSTLKYRWWADHKAQHRQIVLNSDGTAILRIFWPKEIETHHLTK